MDKTTIAGDSKSKSNMPLLAVGLMLAGLAVAGLGDCSLSAPGPESCSARAEALISRATHLVTGDF